jgi:iron complex transport system ATP-binding protein
MKDPKSILLQTHNLSIGYGNQLLFRELNLVAEAGNLICFMGPNGIGKSTLIRTLAGLQKPLSGEVKLPSSDEVHHQLAIVLTDKVTSVNMTVYDLVTFGRYPYLNWSIQLKKEDREIIQRSIAQVHIEHLVDKRLFELSDGQLQMVMIARAISQDTPVILLDEPTAHLDLNNRVEIMKLLKNLARKTNKAILVATHELDLALQMSDVIWLTGKEKNILSGIPEDLVLNGTFDDVFQFKGFDLKTGKVQHEPHLGKTVQLIGEGYAYLWTKNALERKGFEVTSDHMSWKITVLEGNTWSVLNDGVSKAFDSIQALMLHLETF